MRRRLARPMDDLDSNFERLVEEIRVLSDWVKWINKFHRGKLSAWVNTEDPAEVQGQLEDVSLALQEAQTRFDNLYSKLDQDRVGAVKRVSVKFKNFWHWLEEQRVFYATKPSYTSDAELSVSVLSKLDQIVPSTGSGLARFIISLGQRFSTKLILEPVTEPADSLREAVVQVLARWAMDDLLDTVAAFGGDEPVVGKTRREAMPEQKLDLIDVMSTAVNDLTTLNWTRVGRNSYSLIASTSKAKMTYRTAVRAVSRALKDYGAKFTESPSQGDLLEDESASTLFQCPSGEIHVYAEKESAGRYFVQVFAKQL